MSLRDNILFGKEMNHALYHRVLDKCGLEPDLKLMPGGDLTELGENGINLSGGQKQRLSLARAVYEDADIYLLDDPLAALDSHVSKSVFMEVIGEQGLLRRKTRILVTNNMSVMAHMDRIIVIRDGVIDEIGTFQDLVER